MALIRTTQAERQLALDRTIPHERVLSLPNYWSKDDPGNVLSKQSENRKRPSKRTVSCRNFDGDPEQIRTADLLLDREAC